MMSGRYQIHTGLQHGVLWPTQCNGLPTADKTVAEYLGRQGYKAHAIGKVG